MDTNALLQLDRAHVWHPFTPILEWLDPALGPEPLVIVAGEGALLRDSHGRPSTPLGAAIDRLMESKK